MSRFGSKLKGAIRGAIDGAPLEATEVPTVWDAFTDETQVILFLFLAQNICYNCVQNRLDSIPFFVCLVFFSSSSVK